MQTRCSRAFACAVAIAVPGFHVPEQEPAPRAVTSTLLQDAQGLAGGDVPFGLVLGKDDGPAMQVWRRPRPADAPLTKAALADAFRQDWSERFSVSHEGGTLTAVSPRASVCTPALQRPVGAQTVTGTPVELLFAVMRELVPSLQQLPPPGIVSGGGSPSPSLPLFTRMAVSVPAGSLRGALDRIVSSTHQLGWVARERCDGAGPCRCDLAFVTPTDLVLTSYDAAAER